MIRRTVEHHQQLAVLFRPRFEAFDRVIGQQLPALDDADSVAHLGEFAKDVTADQNRLTIGRE